MRSFTAAALAVLIVAALRASVGTHGLGDERYLADLLTAAGGAAGYALLFDLAFIALGRLGRARRA